VTSTQPAPLDAEIRHFFDVFSRASGILDLDALAGCFGEVFLAADQDGARPVPRGAFLAALPRRARMFADAGVGPAALVSVTHQRLDEHYLLARTEWTAPRTGGGQVLLSSSFLLRRDADGLRVVLYLNHRGLPPAPPADQAPGGQAPGTAEGRG
jgi:hypothetical protein